MSSVLAHVPIVELTRTPWYQAPPGEALRVKLAADQGEPFGPATPQGSLDMLIVNPAAAAVFHEAKIGDSFEVRFTRLPPRKKEE